MMLKPPKEAAPPVAISYPLVMERYPGSACALDTTASMPPAMRMPNTTTTNSAMVIKMDWMRSVKETAIKPPSTV